MRATVQRASVSLVAGLIGLLLAAGSASAAGQCGPDFDGPAACPITTPTVSGSLAATGENDYFVFYARKHTNLTLTVTDAEAPTCGMPLLENYYECSEVNVKLLGGKGNYIAQSDLSQPQNGVPIPMTLSHTLSAGGIYYAVVSGVVNASLPGGIPYSLQVDGSPNVTWPPPCTVPRLRKNTGLARAKGLLAFHDCSAGRVRHVPSSSTRRGDVVGLRPRAGTVAPYGARVGILVSSGR